MGLLENADIPVAPLARRDPKGCESDTITIGPEGGTLCVRRDRPVVDPSEWDEILAELLPPGFNPGDYAIVGDTVQVRSWDAHFGRNHPKSASDEKQRFYYFKADICRRSGSEGDELDVTELRKAAARRKPAKRRTRTTDGTALVVCLSDWQIGKGEGGGTAATVEGIHQGLDAALDRARSEKPERVVLAGLGDLAEGCSGWYPNQLFDIDLDEREQMRVASRLLISAIDRFVGWPVLVSSCISNHGEKRGAGGKHQTSDLDNRDLQLLDRVADVISAAPDRYGDVTLAGPQKADPTVTRFDVCGVRVATAHGHVGFGGRSAVNAAEKWWMGQIRGQRPAADAEVLLTGHRHHLAVAEFGLRRTWVQAPAMDGGSAWFASANGTQSHPGLLTMLVGDGVGRSGVSGLVVHPAGVERPDLGDPQTA